MRMKTYLLGLVFAVVGICVLQSALSSNSSAIQQSSPLGDQMIPEPQNPYCSSVPFQFPVPEVECPDDGYYYQVNVVCEAACADAYQHKMVEIYNEACDKWSRSDQEYLLDCRLAIHAYDACAAHAHTLYDLELCRDQMIADFNKALNKLKARREDIKHDVDSQSASAKTDFQLCAHDCCERVGKKKAGSVEPK